MFSSLPFAKQKRGLPSPPLPWSFTNPEHRQPCRIQYVCCCKQSGVGSPSGLPQKGLLWPMMDPWWSMCFSCDLYGVDFAPHFPNGSVADNSSFICNELKEDDMVSMQKFNIFFALQSRWLSPIESATTGCDPCMFILRFLRIVLVSLCILLATMPAVRSMLHDAKRWEEAKQGPVIKPKYTWTKNFRTDIERGRGRIFMHFSNPVVHLSYHWNLAPWFGSTKPLDPVGCLLCRGQKRVSQDFQDEHTEKLDNTGTP